jgi:signal transduction histidine kinase
MVSHEFRNPLASIATSTDLLTHYSDRMSPERQQEHLTRIQRQIHQLTDLLNDFMIIMRADSVELGVKQAAINLSKLCLDVVIDTQLNAGDEYAIELHSTDSEIVFPGDEKLLKQALSNLLLNAIKYSPQGGRVDVELSREERDVVIEVRDHGIGIPESDLPHLFSPFFRANNVGEIPGTGLGLAIAARAVEMHRGNIDVHSAVGRGTTFVLRFPQQPNATF